MTIHKEGTFTLIISAVLLAVVNGLVYIYMPPSLWMIFSIVSLVLYLFLVSFFRHPNRDISSLQDHIVYAPCDGKVVVIEEATEVEYFKDKRLQLSIFMSPLNVHVNRHAVSGNVEFSKYHEGKYLAAWNPKSSTENERTTVVYNSNGRKLLVRQIAGALARRIVLYAKKNDQAVQGEELGFIKLGSRMDLFLPLDAKIKVKVGDVMKGNRSIIAEW